MFLTVLSQQVSASWKIGILVWLLICHSRLEQTVRIQLISTQISLGGIQVALKPCVACLMQQLPSIKKLDLGMFLK